MINPDQRVEDVYGEFSNKSILRKNEAVKEMCLITTDRLSLPPFIQNKGL